MSKQQLPKRYRVHGDFTITRYCGPLCDERRGDCEGHEELKKIEVEVVAMDEENACEEALADYEQEGLEPSWLFGQPFVDYLGIAHTGPKLSNYWSQPPAEQAKLKKEVKQ